MIDTNVIEPGDEYEALNETYIIFIIKNDTSLGKLIHDFSYIKPQDMYYKILADRVRYFKEDKKGVLTMCREMENMRRETAHEKAVEIAKKILLSGKLTTEDIADFSGLSIEEVKALSEQKTA